MQKNFSIKVKCAQHAATHTYGKRFIVELKEKKVGI